MRVVIISLALACVVASITATKVVCGKDDVLIPNPDDCGAYYMCDNGNPIPKPCPDGLQFSPDKLVCDFAENVDCQSSATSSATSSTSLPPTNSTSKPPTPSTSTTNAPNVTTSTTNEPNVTTSTTNAPNITTSTTNAPNVTTSTTNAPNITTSTTNAPNVTTSTTAPPDFVPECPAENGFFIIENPNSCTSFFVCVNGKVGLVKCPVDLDFNATSQACDIPHDGSCGHPTTPDPDHYVPNCPANTTVQLPSPFDCSSFYICISGNYALLDCPLNYEFNEAAQTCVEPSESTCQVNAFNKQYEEYVCEKDGTFPDPEDCSRYYVCNGAQMYPMECPGGLFFDPKTLTCNNPEVVECEIGSTTEPPATSSTGTGPSSTTTSPPVTTSSAPTSTSLKPSTGQPGVNCPSDGTAILPDPEDCTRFIVCIQGEYDVIDCPEGYGFSEEELTCVKAEEVGCNTPTSPPTGPQCPSTGIAKLPNPEDCGSYYYCINGFPALLNCPEDMNFDVDAGECSLTATCETTRTSLKPTGPTTPSTSSGDTSSSTEGSSADCGTDEEGQLRPNPGSCTSFLECAGGFLVELPCPAGLEFNPVLLRCDNPEDANCSVKVRRHLFDFLKI